MCGFIGHISINEIDKSKLYHSNRHTECRGPDDFKHIKSNLKIKSNDKLYLNFLFNRLAIVDLTKNASQPMTDDKGNTILFNGEIFNHRQLKKELVEKGVKFYSNHSDTEVILNGLTSEGLSFINKVIGQFSIAYLDINQKKIHLIRDRLGQKPMFYYSSEETLVFGSNLKSLAGLVKDRKISDSALYEYLSTGVVSAPNTIFNNFYKLIPGEILTFDLNDNFNIYRKTKYWDIDSFISNKPFSEEEFFKLLEDSVVKRLESDVNLATLLSGGIDSSSILKVQTDLKKKVNSFSISIKNSKYDELRWIQKVQDKYKSNGKIIEIDTRIDNEEVLNSIKLFDEPYCDPSTLPSYIISRSISQKYKVAITGDGGDELLGGYRRLYNVLNGIKLPAMIVEKIFAIYPAILGSGSNIKRFSNDRLSSYMSYYEDTKFLDLLKVDNYDFNLKLKLNEVKGNLYKSLILFDFKYYLPEMMLLKIDRTFMANSVEARSPFVDHRLVEYMVSTDYKINNKKYAKYILKKFLSEDFDDIFLNRKKMGFVFDIKDWVFSNEEFIKNTIKENNTITNLKLDNYLKLFNVKSRVNAIRIWKIFFLSIYLSFLDND